MEWDPPEKPAEVTEQRLIAAFLDGSFPQDSNLPAERSLADQLGVTRPTLREVLQRLARDGWVEIRHGKPTRVRRFWEEGSLGLLVSVALQQQDLPENFVPNLLAVRVLLAPEYTRLAVLHDASAALGCLARAPSGDDPAALAAFDWELHRTLCLASGNPVFTLFINTMQQLYNRFGTLYYHNARARQHSQRYYHSLRQRLNNHDADGAMALTQQVMQESLEIWIQERVYGRDREP